MLEDAVSCRIRVKGFAEEERQSYACSASSAVMHTILLVYVQCYLINPPIITFMLVVAMLGSKQNTSFARLSCTE
eukprot:12250429-Ditylum_brightwellii.AAC.1